jgi:hypothetical protein
MGGGWPAMSRDCGGFSGVGSTWMWGVGGGEGVCGDHPLFFFNPVGRVPAGLEAPHPGKKKKKKKRGMTLT